MKALTTDELLKVLKVASENKRNHAAILLAVKHGMRASEVCNLKMTDLDMDNKEITVRRLKGSLRTTQPLEDIPGQPLLSELRVLHAWLKERADWHDRDGWVFPSQKGQNLTRFGLLQMFRSVCQQAGIHRSKQHFHVLKHTLGYTLAEQNTAAEVIKQKLGHKNISSSIRYCEPSQETANRIADSAFAAAFRQ
jgi:type 1 fimbriae regulatory protein FimB